MLDIKWLSRKTNTNLLKSQPVHSTYQLSAATFEPNLTSTVITEIFVRVKISYSGVRELSYAINFRTARAVSHTLVYVHAFRVQLNFVLSAKSTKLNRVRIVCNYSIMSKRTKTFRRSKVGSQDIPCFMVGNSLKPKREEKPSLITKSKKALYLMILCGLNTAST